MARQYNQPQEAYLLAKANLEILEEKEKEVNRRYILGHNIKNPGGSIPEDVYCIEDEDTFNAANTGTSKIIEESGLWVEILQAREMLKAAENNLINYGLSIIPGKSERATLQKAAADNYTTRLKIIELTLKLDMTTI
jgi:hypothetical protein